MISIPLVFFFFNTIALLGTSEYTLFRHKLNKQNTLQELKGKEGDRVGGYVIPWALAGSPHDRDF